jgi:four helix bundle protein
MAESIQQLRIYMSARELEDRVYELVKGLSENYRFPLGNDLRRASSAVSHHINEAHRHYSYGLKLECLAEARNAAQRTQVLLADAPGIEAAAISSDYIGVIKQAGGLIRYLRTRRAERQARNEVKIIDEQVAARA